jgi:hypothetical protein
MIRILAVICQISSAENCREVQITNSDLQLGLTMTNCLVGMPAIVEWMKSYPQYRLQSWKCQIGDPVQRDHV